MNSEIFRKIANYFVNQPVDKAWIFGSFSRGEERRDSDVDILVSFSKDIKISLLKYFAIQEELEKISGRKIDLVPEDSLQPFAMESALHDRILIYERNPA